MSVNPLYGGNQRTLTNFSLLIQFQFFNIKKKLITTVSCNNDVVKLMLNIGSTSSKIVINYTLVEKNHALYMILITIIPQHYDLKAANYCVIITMPKLNWRKYVIPLHYTWWIPYYAWLKKDVLPCVNYNTLYVTATAWYGVLDIGDLLVWWWIYGLVSHPFVILRTI